MCAAVTGHTDVVQILLTHVGFSVETFRYYAGSCDKIQVEPHREDGWVGIQVEGDGWWLLICSLLLCSFCTLSASVLYTYIFIYLKFTVDCKYRQFY